MEIKINKLQDFTHKFKNINYKIKKLKQKIKIKSFSKTELRIIKQKLPFFLNKLKD